MRSECLLKIQMKIEEKNVCKFRSILNTFSIYENFKRRGGGFWSRISENKKKSKSWFTEIKIGYFWEFHKSRWINKRHKSRVTRIKKNTPIIVRRQRKLGLPQSQIMKIKWWKRDKKCMRGSEKGSEGQTKLQCF